MSSETEMLESAPCPGIGRQFLVMFAVYGGAQAALAGLGLSFYGVKWGLVGVAIGMGGGVLFGTIMVFFTRYEARKLSATDFDFHLEHLGHLGLREIEEMEGWRIFEGRGLRSVAARVFVLEEPGGRWVVAPRAYLGRAERIASQLPT